MGCFWWYIRDQIISIYPLWKWSGSSGWTSLSDTNKHLAFEDHLSPNYWEFSYPHAADLRNIRPKTFLNDQSPYSIYHGSSYDLSKFHIFPFGSVVMGHLPLDLQTATSGRSDERYFVGIAHDFNLGIRLYCPINKSTITRHYYKFLDTVTPMWYRIPILYSILHYLMTLSVVILLLLLLK